MTHPHTTPERVLITGGAAGIGAAIAERCRAEGYLPIVIDRVVDSVPGAIRADLSDAADTARALQAALASAPSRGWSTTWAWWCRPMPSTRRWPSSTWPFR